METNCTTEFHQQDVRDCESENKEFARSIHSAGNNKLHEHFIHHRLDIDAWVAMSDEQHMKRLE